ncbi:hypothetical protein SLEP1_g51307 [Rubroshorea leprosula]|uniref:J domain-containing protein n=1 Tax=Rubroshorea leprosula TaxID=152421 RepID=A0AAV5M2U3_9ROSI|nr:hypothetical protein SLEP1_g51307 [Rubroshorea leprosula]
MLSSPSLSTSLLPCPCPKLRAAPHPHPGSLRTRFRQPRATAATASRSASKQEQRSGYLSPQGTMASCMSLYQVLGIPVGASNQEIKTAYRRLARVCHPDVAAIDRKHSSADEFMKIHDAYSTLSDPQKRAVYDSNLLWRRRRPLTSSPAGFSGYQGRIWYTDQCW